jgi:hypothetical protein
MGEVEESEVSQTASLKELDIFTVLEQLLSPLETELIDSVLNLVGEGPVVHLERFLEFHLG